MALITRRNFLKHSAIVSLTLLPCSLIMKKAANASFKSEPNSYYLVHKKDILDAFQNILAGARQFWTPEFGPERTQIMAQQALALFNKLLPEFPDVGGEKNWDTQFIPVAAYYVAFYKPMKMLGKTAEDVGKLIYQLNKIELESMPKEKTLQEQKKMFSLESLKKMKSWAEWTQKREYPANWVADFISGDGKEFDYGYNYSECALVKYFKSQGAPELAPYVCLNDFLISKAFGSGLQRTKTIAQGDGICNFRYKKHRPVLQDWSTEIATIRSFSAGTHL